MPGHLHKEFTPGVETVYRKEIIQGELSETNANNYVGLKSKGALCSMHRLESFGIWNCVFVHVVFS